jgi:hypothetical protein
MSDILLYVGTVLIAFQLVGDLSHLFALLLHSFGQLATALGSPREKPTPQQRNVFLKALKSILRQVLLLLLLIAVLAVTVVISVVWVVGRFLMYINAKLNGAYASAIDPRTTNYIDIGRALAALMGKDKPAISDLEIWKRIRQRGFAFVGLIGIIILSAGFALQLLGH